MNKDLESLLKAWDSYQETLSGPEAKRLKAIYETILEEFCERSNARKELIHGFVQRSYKPWLRANRSKFPTIPPKA